MEKIIRKKLPEVYTPTWLKNTIDWMVKWAMQDSNKAAQRIACGDFQFWRKDEYLYLKVETGRK